MAARRRQAVITSVEELGERIARVDLEGQGIGEGVAPGRFVMVEAPGHPECILLRPFSYFLTPTPDSIALLVRGVGTGTDALISAPPGTPVAVLGPLGNAFPEPPGTVWAVAGGVGAAPFGMFAGSSEVTVLFGARSVADAGFARALEASGLTTRLATDDGSGGFHGTVVDLLRESLREERPGAIYSCGPGPMMAAVAAVAKESGIPCHVSLEERMGCGIGICRGCSHLDATGGWRCICEDGPVYPAEVIFGPPPEEGL